MMAKVGTTGIRHFVPFKKDPKRWLIAFKNGSVGVYNLDKRNVEFQTEAGHAETIFEVKFCPWDKNRLATCSYDGTVRIWDVTSMRLIIIL